MYLDDAALLPLGDQRKLRAANGAILGRFKSALNIMVRRISTVFSLLR